MSVKEKKTQDTSVFKTVEINVSLLSINSRTFKIIYRKCYRL